MIVPKGGETIPPPKDDPAKKMPGKQTVSEPPSQIQIISPANPNQVAPPVLETPPAPPAIGPAGLNPGRPF